MKASLLTMMMSGILVSIYLPTFFRVKCLRHSSCHDQNFQKCPSDFQSNVSSDFPRTSELCWKCPNFFSKNLWALPKLLKRPGTIVLVCFDTVKAQVNLIGFLKYFGGNWIEFSSCVKRQFVQICESGMRNCPWCLRSLSLVLKRETHTCSCYAWELLAVIWVPASKDEVQLQTCK